MSAAAPTHSTVLKRAFILAALLFVAFVTVTGLYARYGYAFALRVYEQQQLGNVERRNGSGKLIEFEDYLRVDPTNLYMRGLLINQLIEFKNPWRALEVAEEGVAAVPPDQQPIAKLLLARAQIARGKLDDAEATYENVLATLGESGEAHYGLTHIAAARGDFSRMRSEFETYKTALYLWHTNTPDLPSRIKRGYDINWSKPDSERTVVPTSFLMGFVDFGFEQLVKKESKANTDPPGLFWRGVYEEEQGHRDAALDFYKRAAEAGDALGKFAAERLNPPPVEAETEPEK